MCILTNLAHGGIKRGAWGPDPPGKSPKNIGFLSNTGPDPLKNHKATEPAFNFGPISTRQQIKWRFAGGQMMAGLKWYLLGSSLPSKRKKKKQAKKKKKHWQRWTPLTKLSNSVHVADRVNAKNVIYQTTRV